MHTVGSNGAKSGVQGGSHLGHHHIRPIVDVRRGETEQAEPSVDHQVLAAIVLDQALTMVAAVEFQHQTCRWVIKVGSADETSRAVTQIRLDLWAGQAGFDQEPPEPSFHR